MVRKKGIGLTLLIPWCIEYVGSETEEGIRDKD